MANLNLISRSTVRFWRELGGRASAWTKEAATPSSRGTLGLTIIRRMCSNGKMKNHPFTVAIEGNIGSGKTTLLQYFGKFSDVKVLQEPVNLWRNVKGHNLLDLMYKDASRWSLTFQTYVQLTMVKAHTEDQESRVKMLERSIYSAKYCFVENLRHESKMPEAEYVVLTEWFDWLTRSLDMHVDLIVYLRTSPEVVHERVKKRHRAEEQCVPIEYLKNLHKLHEDWLYHKTTFPVPAPVLTLDGNLNLDDLIVQYERNKDTILFRPEPKSDGFNRAPMTA